MLGYEVHVLPLSRGKTAQNLTLLRFVFLQNGTRKAFIYTKKGSCL